MSVVIANARCAGEKALGGVMVITSNVCGVVVITSNVCGVMVIARNDGGVMVAVRKTRTIGGKSVRNIQQSLLRKDDGLLQFCHITIAL